MAATGEVDLGRGGVVVVGVFLEEVFVEEVFRVGFFGAIDRPDVADFIFRV